MLTSIESYLRRSERHRRGNAAALRARMRPVPRLALLGLIALTAGCGNGADDTPPGYTEPEFDGLSREEIELQAEPMTPEEAERLGIVDTTIRVESPIHPDSVPLLESQPPDP
jgi:hypothetical protein